MKASTFARNLSDGWDASRAFLLDCSSLSHSVDADGAVEMWDGLRLMCGFRLMCGKVFRSKDSCAVKDSGQRTHVR